MGMICTNEPALEQYWDYTDNSQLLKDHFHSVSVTLQLIYRES